ncbi:hypothetical protein Tco_0334145, partial [Tanacetum coccineum]
VYDWVSHVLNFASRPDIMFAVSHLHAVKRIFRYLKHQPNLGLWYPKDSDELQEDVNILEEDWSLGNARNKQLWLSPLQKQNM